MEVICNGNTEHSSEGSSTFEESYNYALHVVNKETQGGLKNYFKEMDISSVLFIYLY